MCVWLVAVFWDGGTILEAHPKALSTHLESEHSCGTSTLSGKELSLCGCECFRCTANYFGKSSFYKPKELSVAGIPTLLKWSLSLDFHLFS